MKGHGEKRSRKEEAAISALLTESGIAAAAKKADVSESTLRRWLQDSDFAERCRSARRQVLEQSTARLHEPHGVGNLVGGHQLKGSASVIVLDNGTRIPVRLVADAEGGGGVEMLEYDLENRKAVVTRLTPDGQSVRELDLGGN